MKCLSIILLFVFLLGCKVDVDVEKENPLAGTTWEITSFEAVGDTIWSGPQSKYDRVIVVYGKTNWAFIQQDTSRESSHFSSGKYVHKGDSCTYTLTMYPHFEDIGRSYKYKVQIEGDKMVVTGADFHAGGHYMKTYREEWKRID